MNINATLITQWSKTQGKYVHIEVRKWDYDILVSQLLGENRTENETMYFCHTIIEETNNIQNWCQEIKLQYFSQQNNWIQTKTTRT